jgi:replicative DNA helicase
MSTTDSSRRSIALPHAREAELAVIGTILTSPTSVFEVSGSLRSDRFFVDLHRDIIQAISDLVQEQSLPDMVKVGEKLRQTMPNFELVGYEGLKEFLTYSTDPANLQSYLEDISRYWEIREMVQVFADLSYRGRDVASADVPAFMAEVEEKMNKLQESRSVGGLRPASEILKETVAQLEKLVDDPDSMQGTTSGFSDLDKVTAGWHEGELIILAARPAMGKTALALNFAANAAIKAQKVVAFFSLEMPSSQLMQRLLAMTASIEGHKFRSGAMDSRDFSRLYEAVQHYNIDRIQFDDTGGINVLDLATRCRKLKREKRALDLIIIDYLQLMTGGPSINSKGSRELEIAFISRSLKSLAKELKCPIIALSQLNRALENRPDKRPKVSDLRESGSIEQDADLVLFVYRDEVYHKDSPDKGVAEVIIGKNRHGSLDTIKVAFDGRYTRFHSLAPNYVKSPS